METFLWVDGNNSIKVCRQPSEAAAAAQYHSVALPP
jgi:hypothetical protein